MKLILSLHASLCLVEAIAVVAYNETDEVGKCMPFHSRSHGINLVCCSRDEPVAEICHFRSLCRTDNCTCHVFVHPELDCIAGPKARSERHTWKDHSRETPERFACDDLQFPNPSAEYYVSLQDWNNSTSLALLTGLSAYNVTSLSINVPNGRAQLPSLGKYFSHLRHLSVASVSEKTRLKLAGHVIQKLPFLESLKVSNVDFEFEKEASLWTATLRRLHIEKSSLSVIPWWIAKCSSLSRVVIRHTAIASVLPLSELPFLSLLHLDSNQIDDLSQVSFSSASIQDIHMRHNRIRKFAHHTFSQLNEVRTIDLSDNPISEIPEKAFLMNKRLKHLKLVNANITHLMGLRTLRSLTLSGNPLTNIDPFAFLPANSIRVLELERCNLSQIPLAVTQCCLLTSVSLRGNLFYGRDSMPPEVLALISRVEHIDFEQNPLMELPYGLFLLPVHRESTARQILSTLLQLPVWKTEPCTPYMWHFHLRNSSMELRAHVATWNTTRMMKSNLGHCQYLYEHVMDSLQIYRELAENSGCEASRKLRSARDSCDPPRKRSHQRHRVLHQIADPLSAAKVTVTQLDDLSGTANQSFSPGKAGLTRSRSSSNLLMISLITNIVFFVLLLAVFVYILGNKVLWTGDLGSRVSFRFSRKERNV